MEYHILKYLQDEGVLTNEWSVNQRPDTDSLNVAIYSETAPVSQDSHHFDSENIGTHFLVRSKNHAEAYSKAWEIHKNIKGLGHILIEGAQVATGEVLPPVWVVDTNLINAPVQLNVDEKGRVQFTFHYIHTIQQEGYKYAKSTRTYNPDMTAAYLPYILDFEVA